MSEPEALPPLPKVLKKVSPTQISAFSSCPTAWVRGWLLGEKSPPTKSQIRGTSTHKTLEDHAQGLLAKDAAVADAPVLGRLLRERPDLFLYEALPRIRIEGAANCLTFVDGKVQLNGKIDVEDSAPPAHPDWILIQDWKTCQSFDWAKDEAALFKDVQGISYGADALARHADDRPDAKGVLFRHVNLNLRNQTFLPVEVFLPRDHLAREQERLDAVVREMYALSTQVQTYDDVLKVDKNMDHCPAYGGCFHRDKCFGTKRTAVDPLDFRAMISGKMSSAPSATPAPRLTPMKINLGNRSALPETPAAAPPAPAAPARTGFLRPVAAAPAPPPPPPDYTEECVAHIANVFQNCQTAVFQAFDVGPEEAQQLVTDWPDAFLYSFISVDETSGAVEGVEDLEGAARTFYESNQEEFDEYAASGTLTEWPPFLEREGSVEEASVAVEEAPVAADKPKRGRPSNAERAAREAAASGAPAPAPPPAPPAKRGPGRPSNAEKAAVVAAAHAAQVAAPAPAPAPVAAPVAAPAPRATPSPANTPVPKAPPTAAVRGDRYPFTVYVETMPIGPRSFTVLQILQSLHDAAFVEALYVEEYSKGLRALGAAFANPDAALLNALLSAEHVVIPAGCPLAQAARSALVGMAANVVVRA